jgi:serine-type D-Ala-D-Ala carboxypeptidase
MRLLLLAFGMLVLNGSPVIAAPPASERDVDSSLAREIREAVEAAISEEKLPGCVVLVSAGGKVVHREAYGNRRIEPAPEPMTVDTVFDLASLTKPIATATSVVILFERGKLRLDDPVAKHLSQFAASGKDAITIEHLLLHTGGLIADNPLADYEDGRDKSIERIHGLKPLAAPGERFIYSDVGFIVLGLLVEKVSGQSLEEFARENIFEPLEMKETLFRPGEDLRRRVAPADKHDGEWLVGEVHDPRAARLGGVAGHAGLFSTVDDLAKYAGAMLNRGSRQDRRLLSEETWQQMTRPRDVAGRGLRGLGWDMKTGYSTNGGKKLSAAAFGHGGFTGTALWIDPEKELFVIFLSNRLHPNGKGSVNPLAGRIADIVADWRSGQ